MDPVITKLADMAYYKHKLISLSNFLTEVFAKKPSLVKGVSVPYKCVGQF